MANFAGVQTQAKEFANQNNLSSGVEEVRENIKDLGDSVGHMASRQHERAQHMATDAIQETGDAIQRNPLNAIGIGFGVGFVFGLAMGGRR
jgi:ElaB/YqjD/DUF883 family membrane-anchored ribosome-binding protein